MHPETMVFVPKGLGFVPYTLPGSEDIARETIKNLQHHDIVLWEKHGVFAIGESVLDTFDNIDIICKSAKIYFMCRGAGFIPEGLNEDQLNELKELVKKFASS
jgi:rhamnulose-1-phosphate aldolase